MTRVALDLDGEPGAVLRLLRALLKVLGRRHGVRCRAAVEAPEVIAQPIATRINDSADLSEKPASQPIAEVIAPKRKRRPA